MLEEFKYNQRTKLLIPHVGSFECVVDGEEKFNDRVVALWEFI
jgi:hypothetical protein